MPVFKLTQTIRRPVDEVFNTVIHLENFPKWSPQNPSARRLDTGEIRNGSRFEMEIKGFGLVPQTLEEFERNRRVRVVPHIKMLKGGHRFLFTNENGTTRIDHELEMTPKGLYVLMLPIMLAIGRRTVRITAKALQMHLESPSHRSEQAAQA